MKTLLHSAFIGVLSASGVLSAPLESRQEEGGVSDIDILQFALTLEHLENVFYKGALSRFAESHFLQAGFDSKLFSQVNFVAQDEEDHVVFLTQALANAGAKPVAACEYNFPYTDVHSFLALASVLEGVGVSAYLGGAAVISDKDILTQAGAILVSEGLHQSVLRNSLHQASSAKVTGTPVDANSIFTLATAFIASCPEENTPLPFQAFPTLTPADAGPHTVAALANFHVAADVDIGGDALFLTFVSGLDIVSVAAERADVAFAVAIPEVISGQSYVFLTNAEAQGAIADNIVVAGPAIIEVTPNAPSIDLAIL
ncbi:hypothetical protein AJ79_00039 [Helicocarpus griseus UAMH5409]|uniref:Uncharacterized protein n=1 Tax=Helicocarpus griseus UAMH5409 TaxID=1447875 RepID=A0A2B7YBU6_9EURO|nr:hypothetical protein AJ79_00039 [Helicocarpus griseus UAMH5409]